MVAILFVKSKLIYKNGLHYYLHVSSDNRKNDKKSV